MCYYLCVLRWLMRPILALNCLLQIEQERGLCWWCLSSGFPLCTFLLGFAASFYFVFTSSPPPPPPNAALALAILALTNINVHNSRQCASKVGELVYHLQSLTFHCDGRFLVRLSRCWLIYYLSLFDADCEIIAVTWIRYLIHTFLHFLFCWSTL